VSREGIAAAEQQAEEIDRPRVAGAVGNAFEAEGFDLRDAIAIAIVGVAAHVSDSSDGHVNHDGLPRGARRPSFSRCLAPL
jgi:hypothetical protein